MKVNPTRIKAVCWSTHQTNSFSYSYLSNWTGLEDTPDNYLIVSYQGKEVSNATELTITQTNYDEQKAKHSEGNWKSLVDELKKIVE